MKLREAAQQALEAMEDLHRTGDTQVFDLCHRETTEALRAALEQPECQSLTDEEIDQITTKQWRRNFMVPAAGRAWARAIEAKLKEKNA